MDPISAFQRRFHTTIGALPGVANALAIARRAVLHCTTGGKVAFKNPGEFDAAFQGEGFRLVANEAFGPVHDDARQLIYESADRMVLIKVKTMGYPNGLRRGGTLSIEITNGKGSTWKDVVCKVDGTGEPIPSNVITPDKLVQTPQGRRVRRATGQVEEIMDHELVLDAKSPPFDPNQFANRGHFDFAPDFNPSGAANLRPQ